MLRWSIATVCMGGALEAKLGAAAKAGFRAVEIFENDLTFFSGKPRDARAMADDLGLEIVALQPMRDFEAMPEAIRARNFERAERKFELMHELGAPLLCLCSNVSEEAIDDPARAAADLAELADRARQHGFSIGYEAFAWGRHVRDWTAAWEIVRAADRPNLGIVLDSFHACVRGNPIAPMSAIPHRSDRAGAGRRRAGIADGPLVAQPALSLLSRPGRLSDRRLPRRDRRRRISRPGFPRDFQRSVPRRLGRHDRARRHAIVARARRASKHGESRPRCASARRSAALPPTPEVEAWSSSNSRPATPIPAALISLIEGLGFARAGRHRSKDVELFRQGEINIVVNQDREGFAHAFHSMHGVSVCALALRVDSVQRALDRARAMDAPTYVGRIGPGETLIPAVAGVEASLIYLIDEASHRQWPGDFRLDAMAAVGGALTRIDHLSNVVRRSEFLTWSLFYKTVLGLKAEAAVEIADPHGAFFPRSLRSANGALRIPLNISDGGETGVTRFLDAFGGAGYQQIALATDDIFAAVERARQAGVAFLPIPDNYYDDLEARFEIASDRLARMRSLGVLYDRFRNGEFLHIYTQTFHDRFFFEIVQRNNYDLFGAANTPVRLAAQARVQDEAREMRLALDI